MLEKWKKNTGKVREFCQSGKVGTMYNAIKALPYEFTSILFHNASGTTLPTAISIINLMRVVKFPYVYRSLWTVHAVNR